MSLSHSLVLVLTSFSLPASSFPCHSSFELVQRALSVVENGKKKGIREGEERKTNIKFKDFINHVPLKEELPFLQGAALMVASIARLVTVS